VLVAVGNGGGVSVATGVNVAVGVNVGSGVSVAVEVNVAVSVGVSVAVAVAESVAVGVSVEVGVFVAVSVDVGVFVGVSVAVEVAVGVSVDVAVPVGDAVAVDVAVFVGVELGVAVGVGHVSTPTSYVALEKSPEPTLVTARSCVLPSLSNTRKTTSPVTFPLNNTIVPSSVTLRWRVWPLNCAELSENVPQVWLDVECHANASVGFMSSAPVRAMAAMRATPTNRFILLLLLDSELAVEPVYNRFLDARKGRLVVVLHGVDDLLEVVQVEACTLAVLL
jgi:hypothetical protein